MIRFIIDPSKEVFPFALVYRIEDYAFGAEPRPVGADASISVNDVQLMVDGRDNRIIFVTGYCPYHAWRPARLSAPSFRRAALVVECDGDLVPGVSRSVNVYGERWSVLVDRRTGWVCLSARRTSDGTNPDAVEFAAGCVAVLNEGGLAALWLRPQTLPPEV